MFPKHRRKKEPAISAGANDIYNGGILRKTTVKGFPRPHDRMEMNFVDDPRVFPGENRCFRKNGAMPLY